MHTSRENFAVIVYTMPFTVHVHRGTYNSGVVLHMQRKLLGTKENRAKFYNIQTFESSKPFCAALLKDLIVLGTPKQKLLPLYYMEQVIDLPCPQVNVQVLAPSCLVRGKCD